MAVVSRVSLRRNSTVMIVTFVVLAYTFAWLAVIPTQGLLLPWGPGLAAFIVIGMTEGRSGIRTLLRRMGRWRVGAGWYLLAAGLPIGLTLAAAALNVLFGASLPPAIDWTAPFVMLPIMFVISGMWEEPGWTGYLLPQVQRRFDTHQYSVIIATLITGVVRLGWHLPLFLYGHIAWTDIGLIIAVQFLITLLFNGTGGSVFIVMLLHLLNNTVGGEFVGSWFAGADAVRMVAILATLWVLAAGIALLVVGPTLKRAALAQTEPAHTDG